MKRQERVNRGRRSRPAGRTGARPQSRTARGDGGQNAARFSNSGTATDARTQRAPRRRVARSHARPPRRPRRGRGRARGGAARGKRREHAEKRLIPEIPRRQKRRPPPTAERAFPSRSQADAMRRCRRYEEWCRNPRGEGESPGGNAPPPAPAPRESGSGRRCSASGLKRPQRGPFDLERTTA